MQIDAQKALDPKRVIVIDTETTGLKPYDTDEILSLTVLDLDGNVLFDELVRPEHRKRWPKAQEVNGITWAMVKDKQPLTAYREQLQEIWRNASLVVGYNVEFDTSFIHAGLPGLPRVVSFDVMREFASVHGKWDDYHEDYRWVKLTQCAKHYGIKVSNAHSSLGDTEMTRLCYLALLNDEEYVAKRKGREKYEREAAEAAKRNQEYREQKAKDDTRGCVGCAIITVLLLILVIGSCASSAARLFS